MKTMSLFVKWECGCIGLPPEITEPYNGQSVILEPCDSSDLELYWFMRDQSGKKYKPLDEIETSLMNTKIQAALADAGRFRDIKRALG